MTDERRIAEIKERVVKARFPEGHFHEDTGDLLRCQPCQTANLHWVEMLENSPQDIPFLLGQLENAQAEIARLKGERGD